MNKKLLIALCLIGVAIGVERLYYRQNGGFKLSKIFSNNLPITTEEDLSVIDPFLDQTFHFLGSGGTSYVFLGEDGKTILKLFKHQHLTTASFFFHFPASTDLWRLQLLLAREKKHSHKRQPFFFQSCRLAEQYLKQQTGLLFLCLQPNLHFKKPIRLIDAWGFSHMCDLSHTEFALQQKAELLFPYLEKHLGNKEQMKQAIDSLLALIRIRCEQGIGDRDPNLLINFGFIEDKAVEFDLGSFFLNPELKTPFAIAKESFFSTYALQKWLEKHSPELLNYLLNQLTLIHEISA